jgi:hypothetical protein
MKAFASSRAKPSSFPDTKTAFISGIESGFVSLILNRPY